MEIQFIVFGSSLCIKTFVYMWIVVGAGWRHDSFNCGLIRYKIQKINSILRGISKVRYSYKIHTL